MQVLLLITPGPLTFGLDHSLQHKWTCINYLHMFYIIGLARLLTYLDQMFSLFCDRTPQTELNKKSRLHRLRFLFSQIGLSLLFSKNYLLFLPELLKIYTYYSYFIPITPPIIPFYSIVSMIMSQCRSDYI